MAVQNLYISHLVHKRQVLGELRWHHIGHLVKIVGFLKQSTGLFLISVKNNWRFFLNVLSYN